MNLEGPINEWISNQMERLISISKDLIFQILASIIVKLYISDLL